MLRWSIGTRLVLLTLILTLFASCKSSKVVQPTPAMILNTLNKSHPRLILKDKKLLQLKAQITGDQRLQKYQRDILKAADRYLEALPLVHKLRGPRLLYVSRDCLNRIYALALAYRLSGKEIYAQKAEETLLTVSAFPDWNPSHFLDTAEMSHAVGIGYDWLYPFLSEESRRTIREALIEKGLKLGVRAYEWEEKRQRGEPTTGAEVPFWYLSAAMNWNQVCNGGLIIGALAVAETDPEYARAIIPGALASLPLALAEYSPDGAWKEGPGYWNYATRYTVYGLAALESTLGTDFGLAEVEGFSETALFPLYTTGPTGMFFNYADSGERARFSSYPALFWLARRFDIPIAANAEHQALKVQEAHALDMIWYVPSQGTSEMLSLDKLFRGPVEVAVFRSAWGDPDALFAAIKAGFNQVNHGHLDLGTFEIDALGVRWARDLGSDDYNLPGYWSGKEQDGQRWQYYRLNSFSHSVPILGDEYQNVSAAASITRFESRGQSGYAIVDLTDAYQAYADRVQRGLALIQNRRAFLVQDEFQLRTPTSVEWGLMTDADITVAGNRAILRQAGRELVATILAPKGALFSVASAERSPPEKANEGVKRLKVRLEDQQGEVRLAVLLSPVFTSGQKIIVPDVIPLGAW